MTQQENRDFYKSQVEWYNKELGWVARNLNWIKKDLKRQREDDKRLVAYVWSKGVVTALDMKLFPVKGYQGTETLKLLRDREKEYRRRKYALKRLAYYTKLLEECV